jgi:hypothetical protein
VSSDTGLDESRTLSPALLACALLGVVVIEPA